MKAIFKQVQIGFNPFFLITDKGNLQVNHFVFFDIETGKQVTNEGSQTVEFNELNRWFNDSGSNNDYAEIHFNFDIVKKRQIDLSKKQAFYTSYKSQYNFDKGKIIVFIPVQLLDNYKVARDVWQFDTDTDKKYLDIHSFTANAVKTLYRLDELGKVEYYKSDLQPYTIPFHGYYKSVATPFGEKVKAAEQLVKSKNIDVKGFDIEKLLKHFDLTPIN